jgi:hypothetical protein
VSWVFVWLLLGIVTKMVVVVFAISIGRHVLIVGRTARRFREEVGPLAAEVGRDGTEASDRAERLRLRRTPERP